MPSAHEVPDGGYGWLLLVTSMLAQYLSGSLFVTYGMLMVEFSEAFGENKATVGWGGSISLGAVAFSGITIGALIHTFGCRPVCMIGGFLCGIGLFLTSFATNIYIVYFTFGILTGCGSAAVKQSSIIVIQQYFDKRRASVTAISLTGQGIAGITWTPLFRILVGQFGWRMAVAIHGFIAMQVVAVGATYRPLPHAALVLQQRAGSDANTEKVQCPGKAENNEDVAISKTETTSWHTYKAFAKNLNLILYCLSNFLIGFGILTMYNHTPSRAVFKGLNKTQASLLPSALGACSTLSRVVVSFLAGTICFSRNRVALFGVAGVFGGIITLSSSLGGSFVPSLVFCGCFGLSLGVLMSFQPTVVVDLVGMELAAQAQGLLFSVQGVSYVVCLPFTGWLFDITQNYDLPYYVAGGMEAVGGFVALYIYVRKKRNLKLHEECQMTIDVASPVKFGSSLYDSTLSL